MKYYEYLLKDNSAIEELCPELRAAAKSGTLIVCVSRGGNFPCREWREVPLWEMLVYKKRGRKVYHFRDEGALWKLGGVR